MSRSTNRDEFDTYDNLAEYWLREDALRSLDYDLYFSLGTRYYCDAGCKVCYIADNLKQTKGIMPFPDDIDKYHDKWFEFFDYFGVVRTNDDLYYLRQNFPKHYEWYQEHGHNFELCITDNAIFRLLKLDIKLKTVGDVSISTDFLNDVGVERVLKSVKELYDRHGVQKIKYIDCGHPELFADIIKWANELDLHNCVHHDFRTNNRDILNHAWAEYQNTWVTHEGGRLVQIYRESVHLYYDRFYYSSDDASDLSREEFYSFQDEISIGDFLYNLVAKKQQIYNVTKNYPIEKKFRDYYKITQNFTVNKDFNFIPKFMFPTTARFFYKMVETGWVNTKYGLINPSDKVIPIIEVK